MYSWGNLQADYGKTGRKPLRFKCRDGHIVTSQIEKKVDDYMSFEKILHRVYTKIPGSEYVADFRVDDDKIYFIEVWGVRGVKRYSLRRKRKLEHYKIYRINLIEIESPYEIPLKLSKLANIARPAIVDYEQILRSHPKVRQLNQNNDELEGRINSLKKEIDSINDTIQSNNRKINDVIIIKVKDPTLKDHVQIAEKIHQTNPEVQKLDKENQELRRNIALLEKEIEALEVKIQENNHAINEAINEEIHNIIKERRIKVAQNQLTS